MTTHLDPIVRAHMEAQAAVKTFLPSLAGRPLNPPKPPPPSIMAPDEGEKGAMRRALMAKHVERQSHLIAKGLPPEKQEAPSAEEQFGNNLDIVHTRAIAHAIGQFPEADRGKYISEVHDSATKWIASHNGKVIVHGKVQVASSPESAEKLAAKIVNDTVEDHDQRKQAEREAAAGAGGNGTQPGRAARGQGSDGEGAPTAQAGPSAGAAIPSDSSAQPSSGGVPESVAARVNSGDVRQPTPADTGRVAAVGVSRAGPAKGAPATRGPTIVPPGGDGQIVDPGPAPQVSPEEREQIGDKNAAGQQITQPKNSLEQNRALAMDAAPEFHHALSTLTAGIPGLKYDKLRPQKDIERAKDKVDDANSPNTLSDYLGAQIAADSPQAKDKLIDALQRHFPTIEVDDHFLTGKTGKANYPSANVQIQLGNGSTAEIQIVPKEVQDTNDQSHVFYKAGREAEEKGDNDERDRQYAQAAAIHGQQLEKFKARNGLGPQAQQGAMQPLGQPIQIGRHTFVRVATPSQPAVSSPADNAAPSEPSQPAQSQPSQPAPQESGLTDQPQSPSQSDSAPSTNSTPTPLAKGSSVTLKDGSQADVLYVHPNLPIARVRVNGRVQEINPTKDLDNESQ